jgi:hypothetical protein
MRWGLPESGDPTYVLPKMAKHHYMALVSILALLAFTVMIRPPSDDRWPYLKSIIVVILAVTFEFVGYISLWLVPIYP